jgi:hypothetical protein
MDGDEAVGAMPAKFRADREIGWNPVARRHMRHHAKHHRTRVKKSKTLSAKHSVSKTKSSKAAKKHKSG